MTSPTIPRRALPGLSKPATPLALGFETFDDLDAAAPLLDAYAEAGGNVFDTAFIYGYGRTEAILGQWLGARGLRDEAVIIGKGAHTPATFPETVASELEQSLDRLGSEHVDVYFMHRDNPEVPVGEFVDAMDAEAAAGRISGVFGGSNWSRERMDEAIAYAARVGRRAPAALSNNFSLAIMNEPVWEGCVHASDADWIAWLTEKSIPNFAWSSQARGFFTDRAGPDRREDAELARCWYSEDNFARRERAAKLAAERGRGPIHVALAYVLAQPFPSVALIGPRTVGELSDSLLALDVALGEEEVDWLANG